MEEDFIQFEDYDKEIINSKKSNNNISTAECYPWISKSTRLIKNPNLRLHNEIIDLYNYLKPKDNLEKIRKIVIEKLDSYLKSFNIEYKIYPFGSHETKLYLPNSDIDLVIINNNLSVKKLINKIGKCIKSNTNGYYNNIEIVLSAKIPIIKFTDTEYNVQIDIVFNAFDGVKMLKIIKKTLSDNVELKYLIFLFKLFLKQRGFNETYRGGIGSFLLYNYIYAFVHFYKNSYLKKYNNLKKCLNNITLTEFLINFLNFYTNEFNHRIYEIHMARDNRDNKPFMVRKKKPDLTLSLFSPQDDTHNIGSPCFKYFDIISIFRNRLNLLLSKNYEKEKSILAILINPGPQNFTKFI